jgi:hypothetical protein
MRRSALPFLLVLAAAGALGAPAMAKEPQKRLLEEKAALVVSVRFTLQLTITFGSGQTREQEAPSSATGILVDKAGLVMISNDAVNPAARGGRGMQGVDVKSTPSQFRVTFPGETKEYPAILGATESKLGLAFIRIRDLEGKQIPALAGEPVPDPAPGDRLYGVSRLGEGFDYAPYVDEMRVSGRVTKPRDMINVEGDFLNLAHPLFDETGGTVGILISQQAVNDGSTGTFLLPWKIAAGTIQRALKASDTALEEAKTKEAEGKPSDGTEPPAPKPADPPEDGEKKPEDKPSEPKEEDKPPGEQR